MTNREKSIAHDKGRAAMSRKADQAIIARQKAILLRWIELFGDYCTTAESGQLYKDTKEVV